MNKPTLFLLSLLLLASCGREDLIVPAEEEHVGVPTDSIAGDSLQRGGIKGFYLLNEGNMGSNKATLDYYEYGTATYTRNIYGTANPSMVQELGDVGNDLKIYGGRLYAVINCSNLVEVMDAATARHIGVINCPNCRYLTFKDGYGYLTSYMGYVAKFDTTTLQIVDTCHVGAQPDELEVVGNKLYVANSGGYMVPNYENTLSVIDLTTFTELKRIVVVNNLHRVRKDRYNQLWVTSRGDYYQQRAKLYCLNTEDDTLIDSVDIAVSGCWLDGDSLYLYGTEFNYLTMTSEVTYGIVNVASHNLLTRQFISDATVNITVPYGIMVHPVTKDIYLTDVKDYVSPGTLWCLNKDGRAKWSVRTGDIPAHFALRR